MNTIPEISSPNDKTRRFPLFAITMVISVGGFLFGYDLVIISGTILYLEDYFHLSPFYFGLVGGSASLGCIAGPLAGMWLADAIGRKKTLLFAGVCFALSAIGTAVAVNLAPFIFWRWLGGVGVGLSSGVSPMYIAELAPARLRGRLVTVNQLLNVIGINLAVVVAYFLSFGDHWRLMFASEIIPIAILMIGLLFVPDSPRWLAAKGKREKALAILAGINGRRQAETEMREIDDELTRESGHFRELLQPGVRFALFLGVLLMIFQQINGVGVVMLYAPTLLIKAGIGSPTNALLNSLCIYVLILLCTILSLWLVNWFGRKPILIVGVTFMGLGHILLRFAFVQNWPPRWILAPILLCAGAFTLSIAPLGWVIVAEIFPNRIRGKAMSVVCFFLFCSSYVCVQLFPMIIDYFNRHFGNPGNAYLIFSAICFTCVLFCWRMIPETKDLSLEQIGKFWLDRDHKNHRHE